MRFGEPSALLLLLLFPLGAGLVLLAARRGRMVLRRFGTRAPALVEGDSRARRRFRDFLLLGAVLLLATAAARPQWGRQEQEVTLVGVDVVLAMDTSFSMDARDVAPSRMGAGALHLRRTARPDGREPGGHRGVFRDGLHPVPAHP